MLGSFGARAHTREDTHSGGWNGGFLGGDFDAIGEGRESSHYEKGEKLDRLGPELSEILEERVNLSKVVLKVFLVFEVQKVVSRFSG